MTRDEADMLLAYYDNSPDELTAIKHEIGVNHPVWRYVEALELVRKYTESNYAAMTEEEDERLRMLSEQATREMRGQW